jgi:hypothetical protein
LTYLAPAFDGAIDESRAVGLRVVIGLEICNFRLDSDAFNKLLKAFLNALLGLVCFITDAGRSSFASIA